MPAEDHSARPSAIEKLRGMFSKRKKKSKAEDDLEVAEAEVSAAKDLLAEKALVEAAAAEKETLVLATSAELSSSPKDADSVLEKKAEKDLENELRRTLVPTARLLHPPDKDLRSLLKPVTPLPPSTSATPTTRPRSDPRPKPRLGVSPSVPSSTVVASGFVRDRARRFEEKIAAQERQWQQTRCPSRTANSAMNTSLPSSTTTSSSICTSATVTSTALSAIAAATPKAVSPNDSNIHNMSHDAADDPDFLIDDEYSDQPELTSAAEDYDFYHHSHVIEESRMRFFQDLTCQSNASEFNSRHDRADFLNRFRRSKLSSSTDSGPMSSPPVFPTANAFAAARDVHLWRKPKERTGSLSSEEAPCHCREVFSMHLSQDIISIKTYLHRLKRILQDAETSTAGLSQQSLHNKMGVVRSGSIAEADEDADDLKRQIVFLQQQNEDKDRTIRQLQRQLAEAQRVSSSSSSSAGSANGTGIAVDAKDTNNAATQTERVSRPASCGLSLGMSAVNSCSDVSSVQSFSSDHSSDAQRQSPGRRLRRSRTPLATPRKHSSSSNNHSLILSSEDGTLRIPIRTAAASAAASVAAANSPSLVNKNHRRIVQ